MTGNLWRSLGAVLSTDAHARGGMSECRIVLDAIRQMAPNQLTSHTFVTTVGRMILYESRTD